LYHARKLTEKIRRDIAWLKLMMQLQHEKAMTTHQKRENGKAGSILLAQFATTRK
jgi:hypothetical protein